MRRIVTGHNSEGKSIITLDGPPARSIGEDVGGLFELWNTDGLEIISTDNIDSCLLYTSPSPRDKRQSRMPSSA